VARGDTGEYSSWEKLFLFGAPPRKKSKKKADLILFGKQGKEKKRKEKGTQGDVRGGRRAY